MTTFNTIEELLDILDNNPRLLEAVRAKILTEELISLPHEFYEFKGEMKEFRKDTEKNFDRIDRQFDRVNTRLDGMGGNVGALKGHHIIQDARSNAAFIAGEMNLEWIRTLEKVDILRIWQAADRDGLTGEISRNNRRSFLQSDIVIAALDTDGNECFIAVEVSCTTQPHDIERAIRNASYLTKFTGKPSYMATTGVTKVEEVDDAISEDHAQAFDANRETVVFWLESQDIGSPD